MTLHWAGIGSRRLSPEEYRLCQLVGQAMAVLPGTVLHTGAAQGADQAFAEGASVFSPENVVLHLPWSTYEKEWVREQRRKGVRVEVLSREDKEAFESVHKFHPAAKKLSRGPLALHARNYRIISPCVLVFAFPKATNYGGLGGTGQGIRIAQDKGITVVRMDTVAGSAQAAGLVQAVLARKTMSWQS